MVSLLSKTKHNKSIVLYSFSWIGILFLASGILYSNSHKSNADYQKYAYSIIYQIDSNTFSAEQVNDVIRKIGFRLDDIHIIDRTITHYQNTIEIDIPETNNIDFLAEQLGRSGVFRMEDKDGNLIATNKDLVELHAQYVPVFANTKPENQIFMMLRGGEPSDRYAQALSKIEDKSIDGKNYFTLKLDDEVLPQSIALDYKSARILTLYGNLTEESGKWLESIIRWGEFPFSLKFVNIIKNQ